MLKLKAGYGTWQCSYIDLITHKYNGVENPRLSPTVPLWTSETGRRTDMPCADQCGCVNTASQSEGRGVGRWVDGDTTRQCACGCTVRTAGWNTVLSKRAEVAAGPGPLEWSFQLRLWLLWPWKLQPRALAVQDCTELRVGESEWTFWCQHSCSICWLGKYLPEKHQMEATIILLTGMHTVRFMAPVFCFVFYKKCK